MKTSFHNGSTISDGMVHYINSNDIIVKGNENNLHLQENNIRHADIDSFDAYIKVMFERFVIEVCCNTKNIFLPGPCCTDNILA